MGESVRPLVLVVEDEALVREVVCMDLEDAGFDVLEARDGEEALALLQEHGDSPGQIRVLLTDIRMPGAIDGWTLAEKARDLSPALGVVYATGYTPQQSRPVPGSVVLRKPYRLSSVRETVLRLGGF